VDAKFEVLPEVASCRLCGQSLEVLPANANGLILCLWMYPANIHSAVCRSCNQEHFYEGASHGFYNWRNKLLLSAEVVELFSQNYASSGQSVWSFFNSMIHLNRLRPAENQLELIKTLENYAGSMSQALAGAVELQKFKPSAFKCCDNPQWISMDGTVISVKADRLPAFTRPWELGPVVARSSTRNDRQLPRLSPPNSILVKRLLANSNTDQVKQSEVLSWDHNPFLRLLLDCSNLPSSANAQQLDFVIELKPSARGFASFLLADIAPLVTLVPPCVQALLEDLRAMPTRISRIARDLFRLHAPVLFGVWSALIHRSQHEGQEWASFKVAMSRIIVTLDHLNSIDDQELYKVLSEADQGAIYAAIAHEGAKNPELSEVWRTGHFFPGFPIVRQLHQVQISRQRTEPITVCTKNAQQAGLCGPGVVFFFCVEHSRCIGFIILDHAESPKIVIEAIAARFLQLPEYIIYDNGCNLYEYAANRYPSLFRNTRFFVDGFHHHCHTNCASTFSTGAHQKLTHDKNTSLFEQRNHQFSPLKALAPAQKYRTFVSFLRAVVEYVNGRAGRAVARGSSVDD
jgi:CxC4 like cysteine cluster associated with KDZ transposases